MKKGKGQLKDLQWAEAKKRHRLSAMHVQMGRELGLNPTKLGKIDNHKQELWKAPLPVFIERIYFKRFGRERPLPPQNKEPAKPPKPSENEGDSPPG